MKNLKPKEYERIWFKKTTASEGMTEGEAFYLNNKTGETVWDKPDGYISEDEIENHVHDLDDEKDLFEEILQFIPELRTSLKKKILKPIIVEKLSDCLSLLNRSSGDNAASATASFLEIFISSGQLKGFQKLFTSCMKYLANAKTRDVASMGCKSIILMLQLVVQFEIDVDLNILQIEVFGKMTDGSWGYKIESITKLFKDVIIETKEVFWTTLLYKILTFTMRSRPVKMKLNSASKNLVKNVLTLLASSDEDMYTQGCQLYFALAHLFFNSAAEDGIKLAQFSLENIFTNEDLAQARRGLSEGIQNFLNEASTDFKSSSTKLLLRSQVLSTTKAFVALDVRMNQDIVESFFSTHEINILFDICLLNISNLDAADEARGEFLQVLALVLATNCWQSEKHRDADVKQILDSITGGEHDDIPKSVVELADHCLRVYSKL